MIPVTAAIIAGTKQKGKLGALFSSLVYVLGLSIVYAVLGLLVASGGAKVRTWLASPWVLVPIAGIFVFLALSMFDVITIQFQPKSLSRLQGKLSQKSRLLAIFSLGMVSGLVAGPCITAPLAGILVLVAQQGSKLVGFFMLFSLAWGMGIVLIVAGTLTSALPQAGEWTLWVKKLFGFVMLWAAAYFLSSIIGERAYHLATAVILIAAAVFLGGFDALTKESGIADRAKRLIGLFAMFAAAYLLMGDFMPGPRVAAVSPFREATYEDVEKAIASGQPTVLDFSAEWCDICKTLDKKTFSEPRVVDALSRFYALKIDVDKEPEVAKSYRIPGPPTVVFVGSDGKEVEGLRFSGFKDADEFLSILSRVR
jgi:thiol:disulfide interchange protein DsbD